MATNEDELLDQTRDAELLGVTTKFLEARRVRGGSIPYAKIGRLVRYRRSDVQAWVESRMMNSTSAPK